MKYGALPGGGPQRPRSSPARVVAGHLLTQMRRPGRVRSRMLLVFFAVIGSLFIFYGRRHSYEIQRTASTLTSYIPTSITDAIATYGEGLEDTRWDDDVDLANGNRIVIKKPKFHLLVPVHKATTNLCKTLLSAAILSYPPATLVNYEGSVDFERPGVDMIRNTFGFLIGKEAHDDDLVLIVEDAWFQLPAEVAINRFFHGMQDASAKLLDKYGRVKNENGTRVPKHQRPQKYNQTVLFGGAKECSNAPSDPACYSIPRSPLPKDIYGIETDSAGKYNRPRYMGSSMVMGRVADLRPIYKRASEILEFEDVGKQGSQYVFSQIFGEQEYARSLSLSSSRSSTPAWRNWLSSVLSKPEDSAIAPLNITLNADQNYEFGIGLDYFSSVFQVMDKSAEDVQFVKFDHPSIIASPSKLSAASFKHPIHLPPDLVVTPLPFTQNKVSNPKPDPPITELDDIRTRNASWSDVELATNIIVPGSSIPASLNFHESEELVDDWWSNMWFYNSSRALLRQYIRSPDGPLATKATAKGGDRWWDLRSGKGGVWTDRGDWLEWNEVCGAFDDVIFGDGKGEFGKEAKEVGGQGATNNVWGHVFTGKEDKNKEKEKEKEEVDESRMFVQNEGAQEMAQNSEAQKGADVKDDDNKSEGDEKKDEKGEKDDGGQKDEEGKKDIGEGKDQGEQKDEEGKKDMEEGKDQSEQKEEEGKKDMEEGKDQSEQKDNEGKQENDKNADDEKKDGESKQDEQQKVVEKNDAEGAVGGDRWKDEKEHGK